MNESTSGFRSGSRIIEADHLFMEVAEKFFALLICLCEALGSDCANNYHRCAE